MCETDFWSNFVLAFLLPALFALSVEYPYGTGWEPYPPEVMNFTTGCNSHRGERPFSFREFCHALGSCDKDQSNFMRPGVHINKLNEREVIMEKNSQSQLHLILPKVGDQEYHFCLKTPEDFTKAAQALFDRQSIVKCTSPQNG